MPQLPVGGHHVDREHVVRGVALRSAEDRTLPAAENVADRAQLGRRAVHRGQPELRRLLDDLLPAHAGLDPCGAGLRLDPHAVHQPGTGQHRFVCGQYDLVPGALHRDRQFAPRGEPDDGLHILGVGGHRDQRRFQDEVEVVDGALGDVTVVTR
jgi:hypothetical protein